VPGRRAPAAWGCGDPDDAGGPAIVELLTPSTARALLDRHGLATRKRAGQHLLVDPNTVRRIVLAADLHPDDVVLEVGPGLGSLTLALAPEVARVVAVEIDAGFVTALDEVLEGVTNVEVVHGDALALDLAGLVGGGPARFVANLPYNIATGLVIEALAGGAFAELFVMVQREVGERWAARPGNPTYSGVSAKLGLLATVTTELVIPRTVFLPVPNVDSVMVRLVRRVDAPDAATYSRAAALIDTVFAQRRKTLRNSLRRVTDDATAMAAVERAGLDLGCRPETLQPEQLLILAGMLVDSGAAVGWPHAPRGSGDSGGGED
jgi:16S rRNA (adenine1518-N6/adenine1519-N6)-dimethyltransferase